MSRTAAGAIGLGVGAALVAGAALGNVGSNLMPILLPGMADRFDLSNAAAGSLATTQLLATALAALLLARRAARPGRVRLARVGLVVAAVGFTMAIVAPNFALLMVGNAVAGIGLGAVYAVGMAAIAATKDTDRASTIAVLGATVVIAVLMIAIPQIDASSGGAAAFPILAALCLPAFFLVRALPETPEHSPGTSFDRPVPVLFLLAVVLLGATEQGAWSYAEVLGVSGTGMSGETVAVVLSVVSLVSLTGALLSPLVCRRFGRLPTMAVLVALEIGAKLVITTDPWAVSYIVAAAVWQISYMGLLVLLLTVAASADPSGRWIAATTGAAAIGTGLGSAPVGWVLDTWGALALGITLALATAAAAVPLMCTTGRVERLV